MGQDKLSDLALLHVHREIDLPTDGIIKRLAKIKNGN